MYFPLKSLLLPLAGWCFWISFQPPNPPAGETQKVKSNVWLEKMGPRKFSVIMRVVNLGLLSIEWIIIVTGFFTPNKIPSSVLRVCPAGTPRTGQTTTAAFMACVALSGSAFLRKWSYRTLGRLFTYELTIQPKHKLVTSGPYGYVRHPSYTALIGTMIGATMLILAPGGYLMECGVMSTRLRWLILGWICFVLKSCETFVNRGAVEDVLMKSQFGEEWASYRDMVPCKFIPGVV